MTGTLLGLNAGSAGGNAEIALVVALRAAREAGADVELVRLSDVDVPAADGVPITDDLWWLWERLVTCDGVIVATSIMSRTMTARLKLLVDRLLGPNADAAIIERLVALREAGQEPAVPFRVDERVLRPRVAGFIAVGGALTPQWTSLALPLLHSTTFSMHTSVVDQMLVMGAGTPRSVVLDDAALERAAQLGRNVASQLGRSPGEATYLGDPGLCPMCHLSVLSLNGSAVECATCGARGTLVDGGAVTWTDLDASVIGMAEKRAHAQEIQDTAAKHATVREEIDSRAAGYADFGPVARPPR